MKKSQFKLKLIALTFSMLAPVASFAAANQNTDGYLTDTYGHVVPSGTGLCWRTSSYSSSTSHSDCDGVKVAEVMPAVVPVSIQDEVVAAPSPEAIKAVSETILFAFDSSTIKPDQADKLDGIILSLGKDINMYTLHVTGHADPVGTNSYNQKLSEKRTQAVSAYLKNRGVDSTTLHTVSKGESEPLVSCTGKTPNVCNQPNRRVQITSTAK